MLSRPNSTAVVVAMWVWGQLMVSPASAATAVEVDGGPHLCRAYSGLPQGFAAADGRLANRAGLVPIAGGRFKMGSDAGYPEERDVHEVQVAPFQIDRHEVTNTQFAAFVKATGYLTRAERAPDPADYPGVDRDKLVPASVVFVSPINGESLRDAAYQWWRLQPGADWRHPTGPGSSIDGRANHPVVHVAYEDALAYAKWLGRDLPTEAQWEYAARGGLDGASYPWGNTPEANGRAMTNAWQGRFPFTDEARDGFKDTAPVGCFDRNGYGLYDVVGNVWEWTKDAWQSTHGVETGSANPMVVKTSAQPAERAMVPSRPEQAPVRVIKGGSWLCAPDFCLRYRPSSRQPQEVRLSTLHLGFRAVLNNP